MEVKLQNATLGGGCFWCLDAAFRMVRGVENVVSGYAGGETKNPTYESVHSAESGHAEVVQIEFNADEISYNDILNIFWTLHDPTTLNRQGADVGNEYRSIILYANESQKKLAIKSKEYVARLWNNPIVTEIVPLRHFYPAEEYHQNFYQKNPSQAYCQVIINPKLAKLRAIFASKLKSLSQDS
jgi:peptide-methionine (S)-S-oxide reductase